MKTKIPKSVELCNKVLLTYFTPKQKKRRKSRAVKRLKNKAAKTSSPFEQSTSTFQTPQNNSSNIPKNINSATVAHQPKVDIFSDDMDISNSKPGTSQGKPIDVLKNIPTTTGRRKKKDNFKPNVINTKKNSFYNIKPQIPGKKNTGQDGATQVVKVTEVKKTMWQPVNPIPAVGGPDNTRQQEKPPLVKFEIDRSNLKVVEGTASSIQLTIEKSKPSVVEPSNANPKPAEQKEAEKPAPPAQSAPPAKPAPPAKIQLPSSGIPKPAPSSQQQSNIQSSGVQGRMTASSFMNTQQHTATNFQQIPQNYLLSVYKNRGAYNFPKGCAGIPKSFLTQEHQQQLQSQQHQQQTPNAQMYPNSIAGCAGIPKSFLTQEHQQQLQSQQHQQQTPNAQMYPNSIADSIASYNQGPVWEASAQPSTHAWTTDHTESRFDQLPSGQYLGQRGQAFGQSGQAFGQGGQTFGQGGQRFGQTDPISSSGQQMFVKTDNSMEHVKQQYSPSDAYADMILNEENDDSHNESQDSGQSASKRLSAFKRLGPVTQPKKPKLTINLLFNKDQAVREVVDQSDEPENEKYTPVHLRPDIQTSVDDTVMKYIMFWPWKKTLPARRLVKARESKQMMQLEQEQMEELYDREKSFFQVSVTGYPESWNKEDVLDAILESVAGKSFIPCFVEFSKTECKFLVIRSKAALVAIHKYGFVHRQKDVELSVSIKLVNLSVNQIDFIPRLILRKRLSMAMEGETEINLKQFTLASDVSHFIYFPLNRVANQIELMNLQSSVPWEYLTKLVLSHNRIASLSGFDLPQFTPRLKHLDLSYNYLESLTVLLKWRELSLNSLVLEGNPLCTDYIEHERYTKALKMMFPGLKEIDGVILPLYGVVPESKRNYSPPDATHIVSKVLEVLFPLLDAPPEERQLCEELYDSNAVMTITFMYKLRYGPIYKDYRALFSRARVMDEGEMDAVVGAPAIANLVHRWPILQHDPLTFTVDVMYHTETTTIFQVRGIMKVTAETLAEDEHLVQFTRTLVLHSIDTVEYKITNEMIYWDLPDKESAMGAFQMTTVTSKNLSLKLDAPPDEDLKEKLLEIFMKITDIGRKPSERCLETKNWHLKNALEYFAKLLKLDNLEALLI